MNSRDVASLALKLLGVYAIIQALPLLQYLRYLVALVELPERNSTAMQLWIAALGIVPPLLVGVAAIVLLTRSAELARLLVPEDRIVALGGMSSREVQTIAFSVAGAIVFILGVPGLSQVILRLAYWPEYYGRTLSPEGGRRLLDAALTSLGPVIQCVLGIVLFFRSRGLANFWHRLQSARYARIDESQLPSPTDRNKE